MLAADSAARTADASAASAKPEASSADACAAFAMPVATDTRSRTCTTEPVSSSVSPATSFWSCGNEGRVWLLPRPSVTTTVPSS
ncbi:hypothetical protein AR275_33185 [Stenotrophomonas maltophilia]|nr:hypothetical protein AR275_33185 [Stenotrophomonas maltophilia]